MEAQKNGGQGQSEYHEADSDEVEFQQHVVVFLAQRHERVVAGGCEHTEHDDSSLAGHNEERYSLFKDRIVVSPEQNKNDLHQKVKSR